MKWNTRLLVFTVPLAMVMVSVTLLSVFPTKYHQFFGKKVMKKENEMLRFSQQRFHEQDNIRLCSDDREIRQFAFLKVHKAASGTASSIFFRFGVSRGLSIVLPKNLNIISSKETITNENIMHSHQNKYDIMASHVIYNKTAFDTFLKKDAVYVGILREPYQQFKSSMNYMAPKYVYNISDIDPIQQYLKDPHRYEPPQGPRYSWINNRQATEFGTPDSIIMNKNVTALMEYVEKLDNEFKLVIIAEYFDESIILLRRMFNWKLKDVLYRKLHTRGWDRKITLPRPFDRRLYRQYAFADYTLYEFFYNRLWQQINKAGDSFQEEVLYFKQVREEVNDFCQNYPNVTDIYIVDNSTWNEKFVVDEEFCGELFAEEEKWIEIVAKQQYNIFEQN